MKITNAAFEEALRMYRGLARNYLNELLRDLGITKLVEDIGEENTLATIKLLMGSKPKCETRQKVLEARRRLRLLIEDAHGCQLSLYNDVRRKVLRSIN